MITLLLHLLRLLPFLFGGHRQLALENLALHHQIAVYKRTVSRPRLRRSVVSTIATSDGRRSPAPLVYHRTCALQPHVGLFASRPPPRIPSDRATVRDPCSGD